MAKETMNDPFGNSNPNAGDIVDSMSGQQNTITLSLTEFPDLQGKQKGDQVNLSGTVADINGTDITINVEPASPQQGQAQF